MIKHIVTSTSNYRHLANQLILQLEYGNDANTNRKPIAEINPALHEQVIKDNYGQYETYPFPDGEIYHRFTNFKQFSNKDVILIGGMTNAQETMETFYMGCTIVESARSLTIVVPFLGYSTMERRTKPGEIVKAEKNLHLLRSIPNAEVKNKYVFIDLHTEGLPYYMGADVRKYHLYTKALVFKACREISNGQDFILGSVDTGRSKWIESLAKDMSKEFSREIVPTIVSKNRNSGTDTEITGHQGANPAGKIVIIYDDMVRSGGSVKKAAALYRELGATEVHMITTHGIFPNIEGEDHTEIQSSAMLIAGPNPILDSLWTTDTHPNALKSEAGEIQIQSVSGLIADFIREMTEFTNQPNL